MTRPDTTDARLSLLQRPPTQRILGSTALPGDTVHQTSATPPSAARDSTAPDSTTRDCEAHDSTTRDSTTRDSSAPDSSARDSTARDSTASGSTAADTAARDTAARDTAAPDTAAPTASARDSTATHTTAPEASTSGATAPDSTAAGTTASHSTPPDTTAPNTTAPDTTAPESARTNPSDTDQSETQRSETHPNEAHSDQTHSDQTHSGGPARTGIELTGADLMSSDLTSVDPDVSDPRVDHRLVALAAMPSTDPRYGSLRRTIIEAHLPLVHHLAQRFRGRGEPYDDLVQVGTIGLLHSVDRYDPSRGSFAAFAVPTIVGEIRRHFRDRGWAMRIPRRVQDLGRRVSEARETLTHNLDRSPTVQEIAAYLEVDADLVLEALETASAYITVPLPTSADESDRMAKAFEDSGLELVEQRETLRPLLARLPAREQRILELRFARGMSQSQIANEVGVSQMHVSRLLAKSLAILRSGLTEEL